MADPHECGDPLSDELWRQHEAWVADHAEREHKRWMEAERWSDEDWLFARSLTEKSWDGTGFYVFDAIRALEEVQWKRMR